MEDHKWSSSEVLSDEDRRSKHWKCSVVRNDHMPFAVDDAGRGKPSAGKNRKITKAGKEKLGPHVRALHQLVSPMGKSDTASVLQEAMECIRFLHEQVLFLSSPAVEEESGKAAVRREGAGDLGRLGLCLVPVSWWTKLLADGEVEDRFPPAASVADSWVGMGSSAASSCSVGLSK
ncbi:hypothetical protein HPP92_009529 [Vanilla planifolia]|uniref:BHLH domain-containing protein n=1 Tax=Vanilla planifolia TaxID=51239 RepID=A0A835R4Q4_VANPL|nr:hypothetical protein HPP92_009529 [Vanilla planifolia]